MSAMTGKDNRALRIMLLSRHDYRTAWRANFHPLADAFQSLGHQVSFVSVGFSWVSRIIKDRRASLSPYANRWAKTRGIDCYLWRSRLHPFRVPSSPLDGIVSRLFKRWAQSLRPDIYRRAASSDLIIVESDLSSSLIGELRRSNSTAPIVYVASDLLETIGAAPQISEQLYENRSAIDLIIVVARGMIEKLEYLGRPIIFLPHGLDIAAFDDAPSQSPYVSDKTLVSVGSMLFDEEVVKFAATEFPEFEVHLIGAPKVMSVPQNVIQHSTMPFSETVRWLRHATVGFAPYKMTAASDYLADSSMKLAQFSYLGLPAVCPSFAVGDYPGRYGYLVGNRESVVAAFRRAISASDNLKPNLAVKTWEHVATEIIEAFKQGSNGRSL